MRNLGFSYLRPPQQSSPSCTSNALVKKLRAGGQRFGSDDVTGPLLQRYLPLADTAPHSTTALASQS